MKRNEVWMQVTEDEYELPVIVANTARELSEKSGASLNAIRSGDHRHRCKKKTDGSPVRTKFLRVALDNE